MIGKMFKSTKEHTLWGCYQNHNVDFPMKMGELILVIGKEPGCPDDDPTWIFLHIKTGLVADQYSKWFLDHFQEVE